MLWEAQFGDFVNGAQIVVDQFIVSGRSKWGQTSRLALLLPHGYEGNGPEHSSARLERFLQLAAQDNIRVVNCTTAGQFFHLLRRQALDATARPLVVMTPKGLLRLREATSTLADLAESSFQPVLDDPGVDHASVERLVLCSGKIYYDIQAHELRATTSGVAVARLEQLYPFPVEQMSALIASYPAVREIVWAQEEPQNMGAWRSIRHRLEEAASQAAHASRVQYVGRTWRASHERGLSDPAPVRAGPDRPRGARRRWSPRLAAVARATTRDEARSGELRAGSPGAAPAAAGARSGTRRARRSPGEAGEGRRRRCATARAGTGDILAEAAESSAGAPSGRIGRLERHHGPPRRPALSG